MKNNILLFYLILLFSICEPSTSFSQVTFCASDSIERIIYTNNPDYKKHIDSQNRQINNYIRKGTFKKFPDKKDLNLRLTYSTIDSAKYIIPVIVHVIYPDADSIEGTGTNISYDQILSQINALNAAFSKSYTGYNGQNHPNFAVETKIQFCLATTPAGVANWTKASEPGVMRYSIPANYPDGAIYDTYLNANSAALLVKATHTSPLNPLIFPFENYFNIWVVRSINTLTPSVIAYGTFPVANTFPLDGVVMRADCFGDNTVSGNNLPLLPILNQGKVLAHETGHYLNLRHIFEGGCAGLDSAGSAIDPCDLNGDFICDIAPCTTQNIACSVAIPNTCNENYATGTTSNDMIEDYMSYADDDCMNTFTDDQKLRMWTTLDLMRNKLWRDENLVATGVASPLGCVPPILLADIHHPAQLCINQPIQFTTTTSPNNTAVSWNWLFPGGNPATSNATTPPQVTYTNPGTYDVTLITTGAANETDTNNIQVFVSACLLDSSKLSQTNWYFGQYCSVSFATGVPVPNNAARVNQTMFSMEPSITESDPITGTTLFYCNALKIWKVNGATHNQFYLPSTFNLGGPWWNTATNNNNDSVSSISQIISVPFPGHPNQYYIFVPPEHGNQHNGNLTGLKYIVFDATDTGTVLLESNATLHPNNLSGKLAEQITAVPHCNGKDYWILTYASWDPSHPDRRFYIYLLSENGLTNSTISALSPNMYPSNPALQFVPVMNVGGQAKASPDGRHIAIGGFNGGHLAVYDFDNSTGVISNEHVLSLYPPNSAVGGCSFSPNSKYLYAGINDQNGTSSTIKKFNVQSHSIVEVDTLFQGAQISRMQLGPDNKIYCIDQGVWQNTKLGVILNPDDSINSIQYLDNGIDFSSIPGCITLVSIPNFIDAKKPSLLTPDFNYNYQNCLTINANYDDCWKQYTATWNFGDGSSVATGNNVTHTYNSSGQYTVTLTFSAPLMQTPYVIRKNINVATNAPSISGPQEICVPDINPPSYSVPYFANAVYTWNIAGGSLINNNGNTAMVDWQNPGLGGILVNISYANCNLNSLLNVVKNQVPVVVAGNDQSICPGDTVQISATINSHPVSCMFNWSPSISISDTSVLNPFVYPQVSSNYEITVLDSLGCYGQDAVNITLFDTVMPVINLNDTVCSLAAPFYIDVQPSGGYWSGNGITANGYFIPDSAAPGLDTLTYTYIDDNGCQSRVSKNIFINDSIVSSIDLPMDSLCSVADPFYISVTPNGGTWSGTGISDNGYVSPDSLLYGINTFHYVYIDDSGCSSQKIKDIYLSDNNCDHLYPNIFPNPASNYLTISLENPNINEVEIKIFDILGQIVYTQNVTASDNKVNHVISTQKFSSGLYIINLSTELEVWKAKFVIRH